MSRLARKYLSIPATYVPSERAWSKAGFLTEKRRSSLSPKNLDMILFLASNIEFHEFLHMDLRKTPDNACGSATSRFGRSTSGTNTHTTTTIIAATPTTITPVIAAPPASNNNNNTSTTKTILVQINNMM